ncbi:MAG TPA: HNH endonuclease [Candidatus Limnocylindria bacterium]|nr:HNH endonuclease [Candidatus Limnocylindria bacterium]
MIAVHRIPDRSCKAKGRAKAEVVGHALVDDDMLPDLRRHFWTMHDGYAVRHERGRKVFMHHDVAGRQPGMDVSHENANKLDNRRANLRHVTRGENMRNPADGATVALKSNRYRGVTRDDRSRSLARPWRGKVTVDGRTYQTSRFATPEEARDALEALRLRVREVPT